jgi:hypothetical protein
MGISESPRVSESIRESLMAIVITNNILNQFFIL